MNIREKSEQRECAYLSERASKSIDAVRDIPEAKCDIRTEYQRDRDRIIHSKAFRRLMHKTQVFLAPEGDHFRTRLTHTIEVCQISRTVARGLCLNEDLTEAIALGHDLGHTPFGHNGEVVLNRIHPGGFKHNRQSLRVVEVLEIHNGRRGMNLTTAVRDGILNHTGPNLPFTLEGQIVKICDRVAYINHDIDDAIRSGIIRADDLPKDCIAVLGRGFGERIDTLVNDIIENSESADRILQSPEKGQAMLKLRQFMFENVYRNANVKKSEQIDQVDNIISSLYTYYLNHPDELPSEVQSASQYASQSELQEAVKDHIAGMTDRYAISTAQEIFMPKGF